MNANHHALAVDIADCKVSQFLTAHSGGIECHQDGTLKKIACGINNPSYLFLAEDDRQPDRGFGIRQFIPAEGLPYDMNIEELHGCHFLYDRFGRQSLLSHQMKLITAYLFRL